MRSRGTVEKSRAYPSSTCMVYQWTFLVHWQHLRLTWNTLYEKYKSYQMRSSKEGRHASVSSENGWKRRSCTFTFLEDRKFWFSKNFRHSDWFLCRTNMAAKIQWKQSMLWAWYANESPDKPFFVLTYWSNSKCKLFRDKGGR